MDDLGKMYIFSVQSGGRCICHWAFKLLFSSNSSYLKFGSSCGYSW